MTTISNHLICLFQKSIRPGLCGTFVPRALVRIIQLLLTGLLIHFVGLNVSAEVIHPGLATSRIPPELKGLVLIEELNCVACHTSDAPLAGRSKQAPRLASVGSRVHPEYLEAFIHNPLATKPGTTMPDVLAHLNPQEKAQVATSLTHFLLSLKTNDFSLQPSDPVAARLGERLFHSRGCAACHSPRDANGSELLPGSSSPLGALHRKYSFKSLVEFLRHPHAVRPSGRMPDLRLSTPDLERIAHFLVQDTIVPGNLKFTLFRGDVWEGLSGDSVQAERAGQVDDFAAASLGKLQQHTALQFEGWIHIPQSGPYQFFLQMNGGSLHLDGEPVIHQDPSDRRGVKQLEAATHLNEGWRKIQLLYFHTGYDAKFTFEMAGPNFPRQPIPSSMLSTSNQPIPDFKPLQVDAGLAAHGREYFSKFGCAMCHDDIQVSSNPASMFSRLGSRRGCLSDATGPWPQYDLNAEQRDWIATALPSAESGSLDDQPLLDKTLVTFNCLACHERSGLGGIPPERHVYFSGSSEALGDQGRLPPPLTHLGAKLTPQWLSGVLLHGKRQRDYLDSAMPQFGDANVGHMVDLFGRVDVLESAPVPEVTDLQEYKNAGHVMIGTAGLSCIACHDFNGQKAVGAGALDIVHVTDRLRKNWFHLFMSNPARFHPTVIMPTYWPGGQSVRPDLLGGDASRQIEALWQYLEDGTRVKKPVGLSRQSRELRVGDVAEICRGRGPVGYRGIAVGYPLGINLAFDSEQMSLRMLWKGEFANVGFGSFEPRGIGRISFPAGIPFHHLKSLDDNWPYKGKTQYSFPQDHGYQFRGYHLDTLRRPTFLYQFGDIHVQDFFEDFRHDDGLTGLRRIFHFDAPEATEPFYFRAASGKSITAGPDSVFICDALRIRITSHHTGIVRGGSSDEVLIPLTLPKGQSTLTLEYQW